MKKLLKTLSLVGLQLGLLSNLALAQRSPSSKGGSSTGGGSVVRNEKGVMVPADQYFKARNYKLPDAYIGSFKTSDYPGLDAKLQELARFLDLRYVGPADTHDYKVFKDLLEKCNTTEFYKTPTLSGEDVMEVSDDVKNPQQVGYSYHFNQYKRDDFGKVAKVTRHVTEIKPDVFAELGKSELGLDYQGIAYLHECLHQVHETDHILMSPVLGGLSRILPLIERQRKGERTILSDGEMKLVKEFQEAMSDLGSVVLDLSSPKLVEAGHRVTSRHTEYFYSITRQGGGILRDCHYDSTDENYLDLHSIIAHGCKASGNTLINSVVSLVAETPGTTEPNVVSVQGNTFKNAPTTIFLRDNAQFHNNTFEDFTHRVSLFCTKSCQNNQFTKIISMAFSLQGSHNVLSNIDSGNSQFSSWMDIRGDRSQISNFTIENENRLIVNGTAIIDQSRITSADRGEVLWVELNGKVSLKKTLFISNAGRLEYRFAVKISDQTSLEEVEVTGRRNLTIEGTNPAGLRIKNLKMEFGTSKASVSLSKPSYDFSGRKYDFKDSWGWNFSDSDFK